jgi:hypothetical protein
LPEPRERVVDALVLPRITEQRGQIAGQPRGGRTSSSTSGDLSDACFGAGSATFDEVRGLPPYPAGPCPHRGFVQRRSAFGGSGPRSLHVALPLSPHLSGYSRYNASPIRLAASPAESCPTIGKLGQTRRRDLRRDWFRQCALVQQSLPLTVRALSGPVPCLRPEKQDSIIVP